MAWAIANRNGYASCHGGQKEYTLADGSKYVSFRIPGCPDPENLLYPCKTRWKI